jgi:hypothetical protein
MRYRVVRTSFLCLNGTVETLFLSLSSVEDLGDQSHTQGKEVGAYASIGKTINASVYHIGMYSTP